MHEDLELERVSSDGRGKQALSFRGLSSPAVSPDGRWLAYVPTERDSTLVGASFASRAVHAIALQRFERPDLQPSRVVLDLPGASGFPTFSADGKWLYFSQYLDDTTLDGVIDARDRSTLFRVPFDSAADEPIAARDRAHPSQLSSVTWNCQYPSPGPIASGRLIATCSLAGSLDIYSLPLEGSVPPSWGRDKLTEELAAASDRGERLFLSARLIALGLAKDEEASVLEEILRIHLDRGALESADFTLAQLRQNGRLSAELIALLGELIAHRRAERALDRGQLSAAFVADARARLTRVGRITTDSEAGALRAILRAEILDVLADKQGAVEALGQADLSHASSPLLVHLAARRAGDLYTELDRRVALLEFYRAITSHPQLDERARVGFAERYVETLLRGAPGSLHTGLIDDALHRVPTDGELASRLELERLLTELIPGVDTPTLERIRGASFELYRRAESFERRRMIVHVTVKRAGAVNSYKILYDFANAWVSLMKRGTAERRYAERLYRDVLLERAYLELRQHQLPDARGRFYGVTLQTDSLEAWSGFLELRASEAPDKARTELEAHFAGRPDDPVLRYGRAFLRVRALASLVDTAQRTAALDGAIADLKVAARGLSRSVELNYLWGHCLFVRYLQSGERTLAQESNTKLLLALDLASDTPRYRAAILETVARVQATVGNHRIALGHFLDRDRAPFAAQTAQLAHLVTEARSQQMIDREKDAITSIERARALIDSDPSLARFSPLVLDRAALHHLAAGQGAEAMARFDELLKHLPEAGLSPREAARDRYTALLGRGAAALLAGKAKDAARDLAEASALLERDPTVVVVPVRRATDLPPDRDAMRTHRVLLAGLRAEAHHRLGELDAASREQARRRDLLAARYKDFQADEDLLALGESEAHLGQYAVERHLPDEALLRYEAALHAAQSFSDKSGTAIHALRMAVLSDLVTLRLADPKRRKGHVDLEREIGALLELFGRHPNPDWSQARSRLTRDLAALVLVRGDQP